MQLHGIVELTQDMPTDVLESLALGAYRASSQGIVALVLNGVRAATVDRVLDHAVRNGRCRQAGVWYVDPPLLADRLLPSASDAKFVVIGSPELAAWMASKGVTPISPEQGVRLLAPRRSRPPSRRRSPSLVSRRDTTTV